MMASMSSMIQNGDLKEQDVQELSERFGNAFGQSDESEDESVLPDDDISQKNDLTYESNHYPLPPNYLRLPQLIAERQPQYLHYRPGVRHEESEEFANPPIAVAAAAPCSRAGHYQACEEGEYRCPSAIRQEGYYICVQGKWILMFCALGTHFQPDTQDCRSPLIKQGVCHEDDFIIKSREMLKLSSSSKY